MFALLIPRKEFITSKHFHIFLQPLVKELQQLWIRFPTYDVQKPFGSRSFTLKGMLNQTIHNLLEYGTIICMAHQGFVACLICGP
jgi:hypothetical protein